MELRIAALTGRAFIALVALALVVGAVAFSYRAGCEQNAAGSTVASLDYEVASVWLMIPSLLLFAALFAMLVSESLLRTVLRVVGFLLLAVPLAIAVLLYAKSEGDEQSQKCTRNTVRFVTLSRGAA